MAIRQDGSASVRKLALALIGLTVVIVGCHKVAGGGWLTGVNGGKATFGFQGQCRAGTTELDFGGGPITVTELAFYEGQFQYHDNGANVSQSSMTNGTSSGKKSCPSVFHARPTFSPTATAG